MTYFDQSNLISQNNLDQISKMATVGSEKFDEVVKNVCSMFSVEVLKKEQCEILKSMLAKKDCFAVLPTGYGKSLPYQIFLPVVRELQKCETVIPIKDDTDIEDRIIVCCPLVALMQDQVQRLQCIPDLRVVYKGILHTFCSFNNLAWAQGLG